MTVNRFQQFVDKQPDYSREFYQKRLNGWSEETFRSAQSLAERLEAAGCKEPEGWVFSELGENIAQSARYALLASIWKQAIEPAVRGNFWIRDEPAAGALEKVLGVLSDAERAQLFRAIAKSLAFQVLNVLDEGYSDYGELPGWIVMERGEDDKLTGRDVGGLHESLFEDEFDSKST